MDKKNIMMRFFTLEKKCFLHEPILFFLEVIVVVVGTINIAISIILPKYLLNSLNAYNMELFLFYLLSFFGIRFILTNINNCMEPLIAKKKEQLNIKVINEFLMKSKNIKLEKFDEPGFYNLYLLVFDKCCNIFQSALDISMSLINSILTVSITIMILAWVDPLVFVCMFCFILIQTFLSNKIKKIGYNFNKKTIKNNKQLNYLYRLFYMPEYIKDLHNNTAFDFVFEKKNKEAQEIVDITFSTKKQIAFLSIISTFISFIEMILVNSYLGYMVFKRIIWIDMFITSQNSYSQLENSISGILESFTKIYENDLYVKDYLTYMNSSSEIIDGERKIQSEDIETISFEKVFFSYPNTKLYALQDISFTIKKGEHVMFVGENGAGKTSIIKLLLRLYEPSSGSIKINDINIREYSITSLRKSFSTLLQDSMVYAFSIRENLCFGMKKEDKEIEESLKMVNLFNKINNNLKNKLDTPISSQLNDEGIDFSAGEKQRLILAREYLKGNCVYILDEPTSNLDAKNEEEILNSMLLRKDITLILISHNLKFVEQMDKILFLQDGKIKDVGKKDQLLNNKEGKFLEFYRVYNNLGREK